MNVVLRDWIMTERKKSIVGKFTFEKNEIAMDFPLVTWIWMLLIYYISKYEMLPKGHQYFTFFSYFFHFFFVAIRIETKLPHLLDCAYLILHALGSRQYGCVKTTNSHYAISTLDPMDSISNSRYGK